VRVCLVVYILTTRSSTASLVKFIKFRRCFLDVNLNSKHAISFIQFAIFNVYKELKRRLKVKFTLELATALDGGWVVNTTPRSLYPRERPGRLCIVG
jgi:hypothetical protein